jgi:hypothetical protein
MQTNKNEVAMFHTLYPFHITVLTKGIIELWVAYSFTGPKFHTISLPAL